MANFLHIIILLISTMLSTVASSESYKYKIETIELPLDHFSFVNNHTFKLRYLINDSYVSPNGPILFYTGNEGDIELFAQNTGFIWENADSFKALIVFAEHRFYGKSLPFGDKSYDSPAHLGYLSSEQALADFADLLQLLNPPEKNRPVIAIGGSYGGMLAAWFRMKYPHLVTGALASSAPILQFNNLTPCGIFSKILTSVFKYQNGECAENIRKSWSLLKNYSSTESGRKNLYGLFNFCEELKEADDIKKFFDYLEDAYANLAMANYPYENNFLANLPPYPVRQFCREMNNTLNDWNLLQRLQISLNIYANYTGKAKCLNISSAFDSNLDTNGWEFQTCTEMVMPMCSDGINDMFQKKDWDFKQFSNDCFKKYGVRPRLNAAVTTYGGKKLNDVSKIIFSNGLMDPWCGGGVLGAPNDKIQIILIPEGAHHIDLRSENPNDPMSVRYSRTLEKNIIHEWIRSH